MAAIPADRGDLLVLGTINFIYPSLPIPHPQNQTHRHCASVNMELHGATLTSCVSFSMIVSCSKVLALVSHALEIKDTPVKDVVDTGLKLTFPPRG